MARIIAALCLACGFGTTAAAGPNCASLVDIVAGIGLKFGEQPLFMGRVENGAKVIVLVNPNLSTWTLLIADDHGQACLVSSGKSWAAGNVPLNGTEG